MRLLRCVFLEVIVWLCLLIAAQSIRTVAQTPPPYNQPLKLNEPIHRLISTGETHTFSVTLRAGEYLHLEVQQDSLPLTVRLLSPEGKPLAERVNPEQGPVMSPLSFIAPADGSYTIEARLTDQLPVAKGYDIEITQLHPAAPVDFKRVQAEAIASEGKKLEAEATGPSRREAIARFESALPLWSDLKDQEEQAMTLSDLGVVYFTLGETDKAIDAWDRALQLRSGFRNPNDDRGLLYNTGIAYTKMGETTKALEYLSQALEKSRAANDSSTAASTLVTMGQCYFALGETQRALDYGQQAVPLAHESGNLLAEAAALGAVGAVYAATGEPQKALDYYYRGFQLEQTAAYPVGEASALTTIATVYSQVGDWSRALATQQKALALAKTAEDEGLQAIILNSIGNSYRSLGQPEKALEYQQQALPVLHANGLPHEATALENIGLDYRDMGQPRKAIDYYQQAVDQFEKHGNRRAAAQVWDYMAETTFKLGDTQHALECWDRALPEAHDGGDRVVEASVLTGMAQADFQLADLDKAQARLDSALALTETTRTAYIGPDMSAFYSASVRDRYELQIDLLMHRHREAEAFEASEQARARSLLQLLNESQADIREGVDPVLLERERTLQTELRVKSERRIRTQNAALEKDIDSLTAAYRDVEAQIRSASPRYAALTQPQPLHLTAIQEQVLDGDTLLLEYALGEKQSYLWAVTPDSFTSYVLPGRAQLETEARRAYHDLSSAQSATSYGTRVAATALSRTLLAPIAGKLGKKRLLIVSEGALEYIPFAALPDPARHGMPLIANHEIVSLPSASTAALLRQEMKNRKPAPKMVAILADPVFDSNDPRVPHAGPALQAKAAEPEQLERSAADTGMPSFERLLASRREADMIVALAGKKNSLKAVDFAASRQLATDDTLGQYRYVHFATHGLLNSRNPELSGLVFSLVDRDGRPQNGFLEAQEIYNLKLNADLVVLSACQTALGKQVRGEGLVGLTRGFMYAGAPRVLASLWKVPDQATTELMQKFYRGILQQGLQPAAALRAAQFSMSKEPRYSAPYYWAGFTLQGEWK